MDNPNQRPEWIVKAGEIYATVFGHPEDVHFPPRGVCLRFHVKGYCFGDSKHPHGEPTAEQANLITAFIKKMRACVANMTGASAA